MNPPTTWQEYLIWVGMQFPVVAVAFLVARWVIRWNGQQRAAEVERNDRQHAVLVAEKNARIADRDATIREPKAEIEDLRSRLSRRPRRGGGGGRAP